MAKLTFVGGIHPYDGKDLSKDKPIQDVLPKGEMVYPLSQHIGAPAKPIVAKGDRVLAGQKIAESGGFVSAPIYASVSGTVKTIETRRVVTGDLIQSIVICLLPHVSSQWFLPYPTQMHRWVPTRSHHFPLSFVPPVPGLLLPRWASPERRCAGTTDRPFPLWAGHPGSVCPWTDLFHHRDVFRLQMSTLPFPNILSK